MALTPEREAEIEAEAEAFANAIEAALGPKPKPKPVLVVDHGKVVAANYVTINMAAYERQREDEARDRAYRRSLDPCRLGLYGPVDDDE